MFNKYLIERFIPWSLKVERKNTFDLIVKEKEKYFCDMYNHFALSFKDLSIYELHMFRVTSNNIVSLGCDLISVMLLNDENYHSIHLAYLADKCYYFIIDRNYSVMFDNKIIDKAESNLNNLLNIVTNTVINNV